MKKNIKCPKRYTIARYNGNFFEFLVSMDGDYARTCRYPYHAVKYEQYRDANAAVDFMDEPGWRVVDLFFTMRPGEKMLHAILSGDVEDHNDAIKLYYM